MTSSLVGSEMCIRDRLCDDPYPESVRCLARGRTASSSDAGRSNCCTISVSYTHLTLPTICSV
eukprot:8110083-Prorocentrum_lima.AAC.1